MEGLNSGTKEIVSVFVTDRLGSITDLSAYSADFKVTKHDGTVISDWGAVTAINEMRIDCFLDTSTWDTGRYKLYVRPTIGAETPILGPFDFDVS